MDGLCGCGDVDCDYFHFGYPWCPACLEHHRLWPGCPGITETGAPADGEMSLD